MKKRIVKSKYPLLNNEAWLRAQYLEKGLSTKKITKLAGGKTPNSARQALIKYNIPMRSIGEGLTVNRKDEGFSLTPYTQEVIDGGLLGDASLRTWNKESEKANAYYSRKNIHYDHVLYVAKEMGVNSNRVRESIGKNQKRPVFEFRTYSYKELKPLYEAWYPVCNNHKKIIPRTLVLTPTVLLHWFMDDGSSYRRKRKYKTDGKMQLKRRVGNQIVISFASESFIKEDQKFMAEQMHDKFGLDARVRKYTCEQNGTGWRTYIPQSQAQLFFEVIGPCPVPSFEYKWKTSI